MPRWSEADDAVVCAVGAGREPGSRAKWPSVNCPDRGVISGDDAKKRWCRLGKRLPAPAPAAAAAAGLPAAGADDSETAAATTPTDDGPCPCATPAPSLQECMAVGRGMARLMTAIEVLNMIRILTADLGHGHRNRHRNRFQLQLPASGFLVTSIASGGPDGRWRAHLTSALLVCRLLSPSTISERWQRGATGDDQHGSNMARISVRVFS